MQSSIFVSYARVDHEFAARLAGDLRQAGKNVWIDVADIHGGDPWDESIETALSRSSTFLIVLSPDSVASRAVMDELSLALDENKHIVPVLYRACKIPFRVRRLQYIDFTSSYDAGLAALVRNPKLPGADSSSPTPRSAISDDIRVNPATNLSTATKAEPKANSTGAASNRWWRVLLFVLIAFGLGFSRLLFYRLVGSTIVLTLATLLVLAMVLLIFAEYRARPHGKSQMGYQMEIATLWLVFVVGISYGAELVLGVSTRSSEMLAYVPWYLASAVIGGIALRRRRLESTARPAP